MNAELATTEQRLNEILASHSPLAIAVSGGVDSLPLATVAHRILQVTPLMVHAVSPAVPVVATARVRELSEREGWDLREITAGEFADPDYRVNPYNRCYFCKSNLYFSQAQGQSGQGLNLEIQVGFSKKINRFDLGGR